MAYSKFNNLEEVLQKFEIEPSEEKIFPMLEPIAPSNYLKESLQVALEMSFTSEKERSERLVSPILLEMSKRNAYKIKVYSGRELNVNSKVGLNGECDYLLSWGKLSEVVEAPIFSVVEAKKHELDYGKAQCLAQMIGSQLFNENHNRKLQRIYGASTNGIEWRFLKLEQNKVIIDTGFFVITDLEDLLAILQFIVDDCRLPNLVNGK